MTTKFHAIFLWAIVGLLTCFAATDVQSTGIANALFDFLQLPHDLVAVSEPNLRGPGVDEEGGRAGGWVYGFGYNETACTGSADLAAGVRANECLAPSGGEKVSYRITCTAGKPCAPPSQCG